MTVPANQQAAPPAAEDRDKPIPVSERYRKSFIATLTWSSFAALIAVGSYGQDEIPMALTQMKYPTSVAVIVSLLVAIFWFLHFRRSERLLKLASSEFAFGLTASNLAEALEKFREKVIQKSFEIGQMTAVKQPDLNSGRLSLLNGAMLLDGVFRDLSNDGLNMHSGELQDAIENRNKFLEDNSSKGLIQSIKAFRDSIKIKKDEIEKSVAKQNELVKFWTGYEEFVHQAGVDAARRIEDETKDVTKVAQKLNEISSLISKQDAKDMRTLEFWPARIMLAVACLAAGCNIGHEMMKKQLLTCEIGKHPIFCVPLKQMAVPAISTEAPKTSAPK